MKTVPFLPYQSQPFMEKSNGSKKLEDLSNKKFEIKQYIIEMERTFRSDEMKFMQHLIKT